MVKESNMTKDELKLKAAAAKKRAQEAILSKSFVHDPADSLGRLADSFDSGARRLGMVVYPSLFAFILLATYGFYLIYNLTRDVHNLSMSVTAMAVIVSDTMPQVSGNMNNISADMKEMSSNIKLMKPMSRNIANMNYTMYGMQRDLGGMSNTVTGGPLGFMSDIMPWSSGQNYRHPPPMPPPGMYRGPHRPTSTRPSATRSPVSKKSPAVQKNALTDKSAKVVKAVDKRSTKPAAR